MRGREWSIRESKRCGAKGWIVTGKVVNGEVICKTRLVARGFEEK